MPDDRKPGDRAGVNPGYAGFQLAKALDFLRLPHRDRAVGEQAERRVSRWRRVLEGMARGTLNIGSRTPVSGSPAWVTLEVATGGFATGRPMVGGPLLEHEIELGDRISPGSQSSNREHLNRYYLSPEGFEELNGLLESGLYRITVPEEGALLVLAWLVKNGDESAVISLLREIEPHFATLRFYPVPASEPEVVTSRVSLQDVGSVIKSLDRISSSAQILAQKETIEVWTPLYDRMVELLLETVEGDTPNLVHAADEPEDGAGSRQIVGGWPCQRIDEPWRQRARLVLDDYRKVRAGHKLCMNPDRRKGSLWQVQAFLARCVEDSASLTGREVGRIRLLLARYVAKRGTPGSPEWAEARERQRMQVAGPLYSEIASTLVDGLSEYPKERGIGDLSRVLGPVNTGDGTADTAPIPGYMSRKVSRCLEDEVGGLVEKKIVTSGDTLSELIPRLVALSRSSGIADPELRRLDQAIYRAFGRRRSLLLLDLQSQVRADELPWVSPVNRHRHHSLSQQEATIDVARHIVTIAITAFPQAILPNKLIRELRTLRQAAEFEMPLTEELAADIFMGKFGSHFDRSLEDAAAVLSETLYATYYGIRYRDATGGTGSWPPLRGKSLASLCAERAGVELGSWIPAQNGMIIEQQQILTSQNLASVFHRLGLTRTLSGRLQGLARTNFTWVCRRLQVNAPNYRSQLVSLKNSAYAWRQMVFFLAIAGVAESRAFLEWARNELDAQSPEFVKRFEPVLAGLEMAVDGSTPAMPARGATGPRQFLGWSVRPHWLAKRRKESR